jgi:DNA-binding transcriptional MocR family regulator
LNPALRAVARPGDVIAVESPTYFAVLQTIDSLGMKAMEIPTDPRTGMDLNALSAALSTGSVRACLSISNCHNPLGFVLADDYKEDLVSLLTKHQVPLIEDDSCGDLAFRAVRPKSAKAFDTEGIVLSFSSFSKMLGPGFRVGWIEAGRFRDSVKWLKFITTVGTPALPQRTVAAFIESGGYDRHIRWLRETLENQVQVYSEAVTQYFPKGTKISKPEGGFLLWLELPKTVDSVQLYRTASAHKISILPGSIFSPTGRFANHIRISCGHPWNDSIDQALITLGKLADKLSGSRTITKMTPTIH